MVFQKSTTRLTLVYSLQEYQLEGTLHNHRMKSPVLSAPLPVRSHGQTCYTLQLWKSWLMLQLGLTLPLRSSKCHTYNVAWRSTIFVCWNGSWVTKYQSTLAAFTVCRNIENFLIFFFSKEQKFVKEKKKKESFGTLRDILFFKIESWKLFDYSTDMCWSCTCATLTRHNVTSQLILRTYPACP